MKVLVEEVVECEAPDCDIEASEDVAGRVTDTLYIFWVCPSHTEWAEDRIDLLRERAS